LAVKVAEETFVTLRAQRDRAMDKAIRAGRILMRRPGVIVPDDIRADVNIACFERAVIVLGYFVRGHLLDI
jgi:hypothetical protein